MIDKDKKINVGEDSVVIGNVYGNVGDRSVVVGSTDNRGNTILNQPMAVGYNAHAGPGSIAIGANVGAGTSIPMVLKELHKMIESTDDPVLIESFKELCSELKPPQKDKTKISRLWEIIKKSAALSGAVDILTKVSAFIGSLVRANTQ